MALSLILNGEAREFASLVSAAATLEDLVHALALASDRVAIERNEEIAPRRSWPETVLQTGDRIELVHFVGGG